MRVFHADAVAAVDVILEPLKVGEDRVIVDASDFEESPAGLNGLGQQSTRCTQFGISSSRGAFLSAMDDETPALRVQRVPSQEKLCRNHADRRGARNPLHTEISFLLFIPHCLGDFSQIDVLREGLLKGDHKKDLNCCVSKLLKSLRSQH
jgi:hypothetical protein